MLGVVPNVAARQPFSSRGRPLPQPTINPGQSYTPLSDEEAALARSIKRYFLGHPRCCDAGPAAPWPPQTSVAFERAAPAEEVIPVEDTEPELPLSALVPPPLPRNIGAEPDVDATETVGAAPEWLRASAHPETGSRSQMALAWITTLAIVLAMLAAAMVALVGYQRSLSLASGALARLVDLGRALVS